MRKIAIAMFVALALPAGALAGTGPTKTDVARATQDCKSLRADMGRDVFRMTYRNFGRCVVQFAREERQNRRNAAQECREERGDTEATQTAFAQKYGTNENKSNAFGKCVSGKVRAESADDREDTLNAAQTCMAERGTTAETRAAFIAKYGGKRNAFGKCVSTLAQAQDEEEAVTP